MYDNNVKNDNRIKSKQKTEIVGGRRRGIGFDGKIRKKQRKNRRENKEENRRNM